MLTKMAMGKSLDDAMKISPADLLVALETIPEDHEHCLSLAISTLRKAIENAQEKRRASVN
jgi:nitrogen fixation NifU-like protein